MTVFATSEEGAVANATNSEPPVFFVQQLLNFTQAYVMVVVLPLGIFGNTLSFVIFFRVRKRADACVQYLSCLAVSDTGVILIIGLTDWVAFGLKHITQGAYEFNLMLYSDETCKLVAGVWHMFEVISAWIIVSFSLERAYVVWFPFKRAAITPKIRKTIIAAVCILGILSSIHRFFLIGLIPGTPTLCFYKTTQLVSATLWQLDIASYDYIPCILIFLANILILVGISLSRNLILSRGEKDRKSRSDVRLLISLMSVSTLYVVLLLPLTTVFTYLEGERENLSEERSLFLWYIMKILTLVSVLNYCFNFVVYGSTLKFYREEVRTMFKIMK